MINEKQLIHKTFYESFLSNDDRRIPVEILGEAYFQEQNSEESYDLSYIRFAQGEIYFQYHDYETAIFKWENIKNELEQWAKMNIGDAYYKLGLLSGAEDMYNSIETDVSTLNSEVALKLFSLYKERKKIENAYEIIQHAVSLNPDYPEVTKLAREFYEENQDDQQLVMLAVSESLRTGSSEWFSILIAYVKAGQSKDFSPEYFIDTLLIMFEKSKIIFVDMIKALWQSYREQENYISWLNVLNELLLSIETEEDYYWDQLIPLFEETFIELTEGTYLLENIKSVIPRLVASWLKLSTKTNALFPSAIALAWNEIFPSTMIQDAISKAETIIFDADNNRKSLSEALQLFNNINSWARSHTLDIDYKLRWWTEEFIDRSVKQHLLLLGNHGCGKTTFIHSLLGDKIYTGSTPSFVVFRDHEELNIIQITEHGDQELPNNTELLYQMEKNPAALYQVKRPCITLHEQQCALIDTPPINSSAQVRDELFESVLLSDGVIFVIDGTAPLPDREYDLLFQMKNFAPDIKVNFILNKVDLVASDADTEQIIGEIKFKVHSIYPNAEILPYSSLYPFSQQISKLNRFLDTHFPLDIQQVEEKRTAKILTVIRKVIAHLLQKRVDMEKGFAHSIQWNEDILGRLKGFNNILTDMQHEKVKSLITAYRSLITNVKVELQEALPSLLKESAEFIKEDSDFKQIHVELNDHMNKKIKDYVEEKLLPTISHQLETWVLASHDELHESQTYLVEMSETFNDIYQEEKLLLKCDFSILYDWRRDIDRMMARIFYENENIMLKNKPAQILLKGVGKIFGAMNQNNTVLYNQYKKYVENESYEEVAKTISNKLFLPLELFEKGLKQDITTFFTSSIQEVENIINETRDNIENGKNELDRMKQSPEVFYDPLKLFEVNLLQQEFMLQAKRGYSRSF
ncbi:GTPase domain-containing protein [Metabacillus litoralis]|uniref:GTPase domain-containing protein n=1 Tax=Metabacillus litoralis TaxID=152268 RepID=A0A5C6W0L8_9BACI|nr:GTPase domain-containing protein [Metabacillus litoralis]TXC90519.1 GTPase domain-containing protein [Metabacillus litoralis]